MHRIIRALCAAALLALTLAAPAPAHANDGVYGGSGANPMPLTTSDVRMVEEHVVLRFDKKRAAWAVTCDFTFENTSKDPVTLTVGFPFPVVDEESAGNVAVPAGKPEVAPGSPLVWEFQTLVGGKKVPVRETRTLTNPALPDVSYEFAYLWEVTFKPGERVDIRNTYLHGVSEVSNGTAYAHYALMTGTLWAGGKIGRSRLEVHMPGARHLLCAGDRLTEPSAFTPAGGTVTMDGKGLSIMWDLKDFRPTQDLDVCYTELDSVRHGEFWEFQSTDLAKATDEELRLLRNKVYALHGYIFKTKDMKEAFAKYWWYRENPEYSVKSLSSDEQAFVAQVLAEEKRRKSAAK